jgi:hypothetical protein
MWRKNGMIMLAVTNFMKKKQARISKNYVIKNLKQFYNTV